MTSFDEDAVLAVADLVNRTGARGFEIGYLHDNVPVEEAGWYAVAEYRGAKLMVDEHQHPAEAADALARRILDGGTCTHCKEPIRLHGDQTSPGCRWRRMGSRWERGCIDRIAEQPKTNRNASCFCGSGKKWKHCHGHHLRGD